jgi:heptosyltransferase-3
VSELTNLRRILVVRTDRLGDMVLTLPLIQEITRQLPKADIDVMCRPYTAPLLERHPAVSGVITVDYAAPGGLRTAVRKIRAGRYDAAVVVHPTARDTLAVRAAGIPVRAGNGYRWYSFLYNRRVSFHRSEAKRHELGYNLLYLTGLGLEYPNRAPLPYVPLLDSDFSAARELLGDFADDGYVVIHPGSGGSSLNWPTAYYAELAARLAKETGRTIVTTGGPEEAAAAGEVARAADGVSFAGRTDFGALLGVLAGAALFVSGNTGPMHLTAALGRPVAALFSPLKSGSPARWRPVGGPSRVLTPPGYACDKCPGEKCPDFNCMEKLTVEDLFEAATGLLGETTGNYK